MQTNASKMHSARPFTIALQCLGENRSSCIITRDAACNNEAKIYMGTTQVFIEEEYLFPNPQLPEGNAAL